MMMILTLLLLEKIELGKGRIKLNNQGQRVTETDFVEAGKFVELSDVNINDLSDLNDNFLFINNQTINSLTAYELKSKLDIIDLQTALNLKAPIHNPVFTGTLSVDTINEKTSLNGVVIEGVTLKNNTINAGSNSTVSASNFNVGSKNVISASAQVSCTDLEIKNAGNTGVLAYGQTGDMSLTGTLSVDTINEKTSLNGVVIEGVTLKNNTINAGSNSTVSASNFNVGSKNVISASAQVSCTDLEIKNAGNTGVLAYGQTGDMSLTGTLSVDTINEKTSLNGVVIEGVTLKNNTINAGSNSTVSASNFNVGSKNVISASAQVSCTDLEIKNAGNTGVLAYGQTGDMTLTGTLDSQGIDISGVNVISSTREISCTDLEITGNSIVPTQISTDNSTKIATTAFVKTAISELVDTAPTTLDTLNELAAALNDDANFSTTITNQLASKLSIADASSNYATIASVPTKVSDLTNDSNFVTQTDLALKQDTLVAGSNITISGNTISATVSGGAVHLEQLI